MAVVSGGFSIPFQNGRVSMELIRDDPEIAGFMRNIMENKCVYWIPSSIIRDIPDKAVQLNGETYIGRSYINGSPELAEIIKLESHGNKTFATCNGKFVRYFEILCSESLGWMSKFHAYPRGGQPANTIVKLDGADVHIGRAMYQGVPLFGVVKDDVLTVHVEEDAKSFRRFQVLVATDNCLCIKCGTSLQAGECSEQIQDWATNIADSRSSDSHEWQVMSFSDGISGFPKNAVYARTHCRNSLLFIGRAKFENNTYPAVINLQDAGAYICVGKSRIFVKNFEVLTGEDVGWVEYNDEADHVPAGAILSHYTDGRPNFIYHKNYVQCSDTKPKISAILVNHRYYRVIRPKRTKASMAKSRDAAGDCSSREDNEILTCKVCFKNKVDTILIPCYHVILCSNCCERVSRANPKHCPVCRKEIRSHHNIFY